MLMSWICAGMQGKALRTSASKAYSCGNIQKKLRWEHERGLRDHGYSVGWQHRSSATQVICKRLLLRASLQACCSLHYMQSSWGI